MSLLLIVAMMIQEPSPPSTPKILLIAREPIQPGGEARYDRIESDTARLAAKLACPHPYLALEPLSGAKNEVWWFNGFASQEEVESVGEAYKKNEAWNAALMKNQKLKEPLTGKGVEQLADYDPQADSQPWAAGRARYVVIAINPATHLRGGNVFKGRDGTRYEILTMKTRKEAEQAARGKDFVVLEVVPRWSFPARVGGGGAAVMEHEAMKNGVTPTLGGQFLCKGDFSPTKRQITRSLVLVLVFSACNGPR